MKHRLIASIVLSVLALNFGGIAIADVPSKAAARARSNQLLALLPASDGVVTLDVKRFFNDALPKILSANQPMLSQITAKLEEMKAKTGIDLRQFEHIAAGVTAVKVKEKEYDFEPVILARGQINSGALIGAAKLAANGKYREERVGGKTIYIFQAKEIAAQHKPAVKPPAMADKVIGKLSRDIAVTAFDPNTIAFGSYSRVRDAVEGKSKVSAELTGLLNRKEISVMNFAAKMPSGMGSFLPLDNDELGKNIESIRFVFGNIDVIGDNTTVNMTAKTLQNAQATGLLETLEGLQLIGKAFLGNAKGADKQVFARMIDNVKFSAQGNEVSMDLQIPQSDMDILVGSLK